MTTASNFEITIGNPDAPQPMVREHTNARPELVVDSQRGPLLPEITGPEPDRLSRFEQRWGENGERATARISTAEAAARDATARAARLEGELAQARAGNIAGAHASYAQREGELKTRREQLEADLTRANEAADAPTQTRLQSQLADVAADQRVLSAQKQSLPPIPEVKASVVPPTVRYTQRTQAWIDDGHEWFTDPRDRRTRALSSIAELVEADGIKPDTDEYFAEIDRRGAAAGIFEPKGDHMDARHRSASGAPNASPSRTAAFGVEQDRTGAFRIRPTPEEQETARMLQLTDEQYAAGKVASITGRLVAHRDAEGRPALVRSNGKPAPVVAKYDQFKTSQGVKSASRGD